MSDISTIHAGYVAVTVAALTSYVRIPNPYDPQENADLLLDKGFGLAIGEDENTGRMAKPTLSLARQFRILLINQISSHEQDVSGRSDQSLLLMEDAFTLIKAIEGDFTLNGEDHITTYQGSNGISFLIADRARYFSTELTFETEYFESLI